MKPNPNPNKDRARKYQRAADILSVGRGVLGIALGVEIASTKHARTPLAVIGVAALSVTDYIDGKLATKAQKLDRSISRKTGARVDQLSDKVMTHAIMAGLVINALRNKKYGNAACLISNQIVQGARDIKVAPVRTLAEEHNVDAGARKGGKRKTLANTAALISATVPVPERYNRAADTASSTLLTAGSYLSVDSGIALVRELREGIAEKQATFALDDTILEPAPDILPSELQ